jgi:hypothetical protein
VTVSEASGAAGSHAGNARPDASVVTRGSAVGLAIGRTLGVAGIGVPDGVEGLDWVVPSLGSVDGEAVEPELQADSATNTATMVAAADLPTGLTSLRESARCSNAGRCRSL